MTQASKRKSRKAAAAPPDGCCDLPGADKLVLAPAELAEPLHPEDAELAMLAKALAHPVRILILRNLLRIGTCYFGRLADLLPVAASTASQHLSILKEAGLVRGEIDDQRPCYCVDLAQLRRLQHLLGDL